MFAQNFLDRPTLGVHVHGLLALGKAGTGEEPAIAPETIHHRFSALLAGVIAGLSLGPLHVGVRLFQRGLERPIKLVQHVHPIHVGFLNLVKLLLHMRSKLDVHDMREVLDQFEGDHLAASSRMQSLFFQLHVSPILYGLDDRGVRAGSAYAFGFQLLDQ